MGASDTALRLPVTYLDRAVPAKLGGLPQTALRRSPACLALLEFFLDSEAFESLHRIVSLLMFPSCMKFARLLDQKNRGLDLLTEVGTQCERAVIVQLLVTSPPHGIAHSLYLNLSSKFQSFPICDVRKHELCLPNLAR